MYIDDTDNLQQHNIKVMKDSTCTAEIAITTEGITSM